MKEYKNTGICLESLSLAVQEIGRIIRCRP